MPEISGYNVDSSYINWPVRWTMTLSRSRTGGGSASAPATMTRSSPDPADHVRRLRGVADDRFTASHLMSNLRRHLFRLRQVRRAKPEMPRERFVERRRNPGRDDHSLRANAAGGSQHIGRLARERHLFHGRSLEQLDAALRRGSGEPEARPIRIERRSVLGAQTDSRRERRFAGDRARVEQRSFETGVAARLLLPLQTNRLLRQSSQQSPSAVVRRSI